MPRLPRIYIEGVLYFVTCQGIHDLNLFNDKTDYESYLQLLAKYKKEYGFRLFAFTLLPKQLYLVIELKNNIAISNIMHDLNSLYTKVFNNRYQDKGHLFEGRFKSVLVQKDKYLLRLTQYIHLFPQRIGAASDYKDYEFSSYKLYTQVSSGQDLYKDGKVPDMQSEIQEVFSHIKEEDKPKAYENFVSLDTDKELDNLYRLLTSRAFVGSKEFVEEMKNKIEALTKEEEKAEAQSKPRKIFVATGIIVILFLAAINIFLYARNLTMRNKLDLAKYEFSKSLEFVQVAASEKDTKQLNGSVWEVNLIPVLGGEAKKDILNFDKGKFLSDNFSNQGFPMTNFSLSTEDDGTMVWETIQTREDGATLNWHGVWSGSTMKGLLSLRIPGKENEDFSFISIRRLIRK